MTDGGTAAEGAPGVENAPAPTSAGRLLREARQAQGLHIAALASAIKVTPRKLEALEADRFDELPDATFTRALAQTVCRTLKIDPAPVLALLPPSRSHRLEKAGPGLNTRMRERPRPLQTGDRGGIGRLALWGSVLLLLAAAAVYFMPDGWLPALSDRNAESAESTVSGGAVPVFPPATSAVEVGAPTEVRAPSDLASEIGAGAPPASNGASDAAGTSPVAMSSADRVAADPRSPMGAPPVTPSAAAVPLLRLRASGDSWIGVVDGQGQTLLGRTLKAGDTVDLEGTAPLRVRIGNAAGTEVIFRGEPVAIDRYTRGNLATVELK